MSKALDECANDDRCKVVVVTGEGDTFCAGGDIKSMHEASDLPEYLRRISRAINRSILAMRRMGKPVIAAINGTALGAGFTLVLGADIRIAVNTSRFSMAFRDVGLAAGSGTFMLPRMIGYAKACQMILVGDIIDAKEAYRWGMVNEVVKAKDLVKVTNKYVARLAKGPLKALAMSKDLLNKGLDSKMADHYDREAEAISRSGKTEDGKEGIAAFVEKRKPRFGRR
jgi:2-(1,2-epoxy-1,2-dihydrophenyl)acetyl-CoA isomerase